MNNLEPAFWAAMFPLVFSFLVFILATWGWTGVFAFTYAFHWITADALPPRS